MSPVDFMIWAAVIAVVTIVGSLAACIAVVLLRSAYTFLRSGRWER